MTARRPEREAGPAVTVIVPTHDRPAMLRRAVQSVFDQTFGDWELIGVDDASMCDVARSRHPQSCAAQGFCCWSTATFNWAPYCSVVPSSPRSGLTSR